MTNDCTLTEKRRYDLIDLVRIVLAFFIVATHSSLGTYIYPWVRIAVPLFFTISSFFLFSKINASNSDDEKRAVLLRFALRNAKLYLFWFIVLLPVIFIVHRDLYFSNGIMGILNLILNIFVGSTFQSSWFISALVIGAFIVFYSSKVLKNKALVIIFGIVFVLVALRSSYIDFFSGVEWGLKLAGYYEAFLNTPYTSFPAGLFWIAMGKVFADGFRIKLKPSIVLSCISAVLLFLEWFFIKTVTTPSVYTRDVYLMLGPLCVFLFNILISVKPVSIKCAQMLRKMSAIIFAMHGSVIVILYGICKLAKISLPNIVIFLLTAVICVSVSLIILKLEKFKYLRWLKYSH